MSPRIGLDLPTLLEVATELADRNGFEAVTLSTLAQKLKIRPPSLYNHVAGLPELRRLLAYRGLDELAGRLEQEVTDLSGDDAIWAFCRAYLHFARAHPGLYQALQAAPAPGDELLGPAGERVLKPIYQTMDGYGLKGDHAVHAVRGIRSLLHGFVTLELQGGFGLPLDLDITFQVMVETFLAGIKKMDLK